MSFRGKYKGDTYILQRSKHKLYEASNSFTRVEASIKTFPEAKTKRSTNSSSISCKSICNLSSPASTFPAITEPCSSDSLVKSVTTLDRSFDRPGLNTRNNGTGLDLLNDFGFYQNSMMSKNVTLSRNDVSMNPIEDSNKITTCVSNTHISVEPPLHTNSLLEAVNNSTFICELQLKKVPSSASVLSHSISSNVPMLNNILGTKTLNIVQPPESLIFSQPCKLDLSSHSAYDYNKEESISQYKDLKTLNTRTPLSYKSCPNSLSSFPSPCANPVNHVCLNTVTENTLGTQCVRSLRPSKCFEFLGDPADSTGLDQSREEFREKEINMKNKQLVKEGKFFSCQSGTSKTNQPTPNKEESIIQSPLLSAPLPILPVSLNEKSSHSARLAGRHLLQLLNPTLFDASKIVISETVNERVSLEQPIPQHDDLQSSDPYRPNKKGYRIININNPTNKTESSCQIDNNSCHLLPNINVPQNSLSMIPPIDVLSDTLSVIYGTDSEIDSEQSSSSLQGSNSLLLDNKYSIKTTVHSPGILTHSEDKTSNHTVPLSCIVGGYCSSTSSVVSSSTKDTRVSEPDNCTKPYLKRKTRKKKFAVEIKQQSTLNPVVSYLFTHTKQHEVNTLSHCIRPFYRRVYNEEYPLVLKNSKVNLTSQFPMIVNKKNSITNSGNIKWRKGLFDKTSRFNKDNTICQLTNKAVVSSSPMPSKFANPLYMRSPDPAYVPVPNWLRSLSTDC